MGVIIVAKPVTVHATKNDAETDAWTKASPDGTSGTRSLNRPTTLEKQPCCVCESTHILNAHHDDYSKPLSVLWHCRIHHVERHRLERLHGRGQTLFAFMQEVAA